METPDFEHGRVYFKQSGAERVKLHCRKSILHRLTIKTGIETLCMQGLIGVYIVHISRDWGETVVTIIGVFFTKVNHLL